MPFPFKVGESLNAPNSLAQLWVEDAVNLSKRDGTNGQSFRIFNTYIDANNWQRLRLGSEGANQSIIVEAAGSPVPGHLYIYTAGATAGNLFLGTRGVMWWYIHASGALASQPDAGADIGFSTGGRPRNIYQAGGIFQSYNPGAGIANDGTNYERLRIEWNGNISWIGNQAAGTGGSRPFALMSNGGIFIRPGNLGAGWFWTNSGQFWPETDNVFDIGDPTYRVRNFYVGTNITTPKVTLGADPVNPMEATTKQYVDAKIASLQTQINNLQTQINQNTSNIAALQASTANLQSQIDAVNTSLTALTARVGTNETNIAAIIAHDSTQDQALSDLDHRVTALEQGGTVAPGGPFIGDLVHTTDANGHCQPSIVYEDWDGRNANGTISIAVLSPVRLAESPWDSYIEVHPQNGHVEPPFTTWHWPEMAFQYRRNLFAKVAAHAT